ncbi:uncharacterized protein LOC123498098 [Portunus trituberculatus]|uniref:uncharacterized protein LOC123498098 n=1 Tax=Portunus trituberculatus TaxID=210409 RepID=UPI001E1CCFB6|nr:uncharacterized protein LOC123498098 [Portunus trituberculatus]
MLGIFSLKTSWIRMSHVRCAISTSLTSHNLPAPAAALLASSYQMVCHIRHCNQGVKFHQEKSTSVAALKPEKRVPLYKNSPLKSRKSSCSKKSMYESRFSSNRKIVQELTAGRVQETPFQVVVGLASNLHDPKAGELLAILSGEFAPLTKTAEFHYRQTYIV